MGLGVVVAVPAQSEAITWLAAVAIKTFWCTHRQKCSRLSLCKSLGALEFRNGRAQLFGG